MESSRRLKHNDGELRRLQQEFEADFSKPKDHTTATWIRGEVVQKGKNPGSTMHSATMGITPVEGQVYQPGQSASKSPTIPPQGDPNSTNIFIASISPNLAEKDLEDKFGPFGPLTSIKVMYPRTEDEKMRGRNCAFVAFCCRKDAERCMGTLQNTQWYGHELKLGWGKAIPNILQQPPIYMPERLKWFLAPPPPSKLPLNAQPPGEIPDESLGVDQLKQCTVRVVIPTDQQLVRLINRVVEFVIKEGPMFEAILMDRENNNPMFQFLFDYSCPAHSYYRWRLYSVLQGESLDQWSTKKFVMYKNGPKWRPPILNFKIHGMPEQDAAADDDFGMLKRFHLNKEQQQQQHRKQPSPSFQPIGHGMKSQFASNPADKELEQWADKEKDESKTKTTKQPFKPAEEPVKDTSRHEMGRAARDEFDQALRTLVPIRELIGDLMALCLEQSDHAALIVLEIKDAIVNQDCLLNQRLARVYLMSDILFNSTAVPKGSKYRALFAEHQVEIFERLNQIHTAIQSRFVAEQFKTRVMTLLRAWTDWSVYAGDLLVKLNNTFLGITPSDDTDDDIDGEPINESDDEVDGKPMSEEDDDVDGQPMETSEETQQKKKPISGIGTGFVKSKWEVIDEEDIKAEAVTSAEIFAETKRKDQEQREKEAEEEEKKEKKEAKPQYLQSDAWRKRMRAIEVKVIEYAESLRVKEESPQAEAYRSTLIRSATAEFRDNPGLWDEEDRADRSPPPKKEKKSKKSRYDDDYYEESSSKSRSRKRSRSRDRHHRSRSRSRDRSRHRRHRR